MGPANEPSQAGRAPSERRGSLRDFKLPVTSKRSGTFRTSRSLLLFYNLHEAAIHSRGCEIDTTVINRNRSAGQSIFGGERSAPDPFAVQSQTYFCRLALEMTYD